MDGTQRNDYHDFQPKIRRTYIYATQCKLRISIFILVQPRPVLEHFLNGHQCRHKSRVFLP